MSKRNLSITIGMVAALAVTSVASGAANKIKTFTPEPSTAEADAGADGMAILNYSSGTNKTVIQVILSDFVPGSTYYIAIVSPQGIAFIDREGVTANSKGNANYHAEFPSNASTWDIHVFADPDGDDLRATGDNTN